MAQPKKYAVYEKGRLVYLEINPTINSKIELVINNFGKSVSTSAQCIL